MNRPIEFRAWIDQSTKYCTAKPEMEYFLDEKPYIVLHPGKGELWFNGDDEDATRKVEGKITLMQWTGLTDQNGTKIFEGDICEGFIGQRKVVTEVMFSPRGGSFVFKNGDSYRYIADTFRNHNDENDCIVIGNIFEHPHLLETK